MAITFVLTGGWTEEDLNKLKEMEVTK